MDSVEFYRSSESMLEVIEKLWEDGSTIGAILVIIFAILIPIVKLILLVTAETMKWKRPELANRCIAFVQAASKWACPDLFAYILLDYVIWDMYHPPILNAAFNLDLGFTFYAMFCVGSTVSSLGMEKPKIEAKPSTAPMPKIAFALLCLAVAAFAASLAVGLALPLMAMRLDIGILVERGEIPGDAVPFIEELHIAEMAKTDVTVGACTALLADYSEGFYVSSFLAVILLTIFVVALPILDMIALFIAALQSTRRTPSWAFAVSEKLNKLAMLDVATFGIVVTVCAGHVYRKKGLVMSFCPGLIGLILASLCNIGAYQLVRVYAPVSALEGNCGLTKGEPDVEAMEATGNTDSPRLTAK